MYVSYCMNLEFILKGQFKGKSIPTNEAIISTIIETLSDNKLNSVLLLSEYSIVNETTLFYSFHPASDPINFEIEDKETNTITVSINTGYLGAGYHKFVINILERVANRLDIKWVEDEKYFDTTSYFKTRDFESLKKYFLNFFIDYANSLLKNHEKGFSNFMISMPYDFPIIEKEYFALSALGYWGKSWFNDFVSADDEKKIEYAREFFIWYDDLLDANFWFKSAISIIWLYFPFREIIDDREEEVCKKIVFALDKAYSLDTSILYPFDIWKNAALYIQSPILAADIENKKKLQTKQIPHNIGFRNELGRYELAGGFSIVLPMRMNKYIKDETLIEFKDTNIYIAFQVYSFEDKNISTITEYVKSQLELADSDKGTQIDIDFEDDSMKAIAYEKTLPSGEHIITTSIVTESLALIGWFTYENPLIKNKLIGYIKSIEVNK